MKRNFILLILPIIVLLTGCGISQPKLPEYSVSDEDKIGYIINVENKIEHTHMGTTIFNNFNKTYNYEWNLSQYIDKYINKKMSSKLIDLSKLGYSIEALKGLIIAQDGQWIISKRDKYNKLVKDLNLKAIILINDEPNNYFSYPSSYNVEGTGLLSHHVLGMKRYFSVLGVKSHIYLLNPQGAIVTRDENLSILYDPLISSYEEKSGFNAPIDIENLTEKEFEPVKNINIKHLNFLLDKTLKYLK